MKDKREIDEMVARKVLKWTDCSDKPERCDYFDTDCVLCKDIPHFSDCMYEAWKVVESFKGDSDVHVTANFEGDYTCEIMPPAAKASVTDEFAPMAICLAALKRIRWEPPKDEEKDN